MFNKLAQWLVGLAQRKVGGSMLKAGDQVFMDRLFWAKYRFRSMRATYYGDLAKRILHMPGSPFPTISPRTQRGALASR
ncbi:hypothetical protein [Cupriavidus sp. D39]|uniref:hypothetical protein n=1 Tax=Cupriavidus sp. D39 TaxID=2997877 RepID=UPI00226EAF3F|nr:hypothetical protein [Cupriavidus sp. D39]MCY0853399.1 hypothetical protein [Cupriavidus sp. D39]